MSNNALEPKLHENTKSKTPKDPNIMKPLGLPDGSVRAIVVLSLTLGGVVCLLAWAFGKEAAKEATMYIMPVVVGLVADYVNKRHTESKAKIKKQTEPLKP